MSTKLQIKKHYIMKKLFIIIALFLTFSTVAQDIPKHKTQTFEELIKPYVQRTLDAVDKGINLVEQETPIVIQQYLFFEAISYWLLIIFGFILIPLSIFLGKKWEKYLNWGGAGPEWFAYISGSFFGILLIFENIMPAIKVTWFPKLYLVEKFINLL